MKNILLFFLVLLAYQVAYSQKLYTKSDKAARMYTEAYLALERNDGETAKILLDKALKIDSAFAEAWLLKAEIYREKQDLKSAIIFYKKGYQCNPRIFFEVMYYIADSYYLDGNYAEAMRWFDGYLQSEFDKSAALAEKAKYKMKSCIFANHAVKNPVPFEPKNLGKMINTLQDEYSPVVDFDQNLIIFSRAQVADAKMEDFYTSVKSENEWISAKNMGYTLNTEGNEGSPALNASGDFIVYAACNRSDGLGRCDLYWAYRRDTLWARGGNMGNMVNSVYWDSHPALTADGKRIFFVSNRPGGKGGMDIWTSALDEDGKWTSPANLGDSINTSADEMYPFMHADGKTLYFSSDGWPGMGQKDIFFTQMKNGYSNWKTPVNIGYPINTASSETGIVIAGDAHTAYFASSRAEGFGGIDIYSFDLPIHVRPKLAFKYIGLALDKNTEKPVYALVSLVSIEDSSNTFTTVNRNATGKFDFYGANDSLYLLSILSVGYMPYQKLVVPDTLHSTVLHLHMLSKITKNQQYVIPALYFDTDKFELKSESYASLNTLVSFMELNPGVSIEISGHTDNTGNAASNAVLSENRAKSVVQYLQTYGISAARLTYKGYGSAKPIDSNTSSEGKARNRRTEILIISTE